MTVDEFIEKYKELDEAGKNLLLNDLITTEYVSYATKIADCKRIIQSTSYTNTEPNMFCMNSPSRYMLLNLQLVMRYTNLKIEQNGETILEAFDELERVDALREIIMNIPEREVETYNRILDMMLKDFEMNERSLVGFLDAGFNTLNILGDEIYKLMDTVSV